MNGTRLLLGVLALSASACTTLPAAPRPDTRALLGTWTVDLCPQPDAPAYLKTFVVTAVTGNTFEGSFYDTPITHGRINVDWGTVRVAFVTSDRSGAYMHSAVLSGGRLEGLINATGRGFLSYWIAVQP